MPHLRSWRRTTLVARAGLFAALWSIGGAPDGRSAESAVPEAAKPGVLLLRNGQTVQGRILKSGDAYIVKLAHGEMTVPGMLVRMQVETLREGYLELRETAIEHGSAGAHITLARWCLKNQLLGEARTELQDALALEPTRDEARDMLRRLDDLLENGRPSQKRTQDAWIASRINPFAAEEAESLGGLPKDLAQQFTRR